MLQNYCDDQLWRYTAAGPRVRRRKHPGGAIQIDKRVKKCLGRPETRSMFTFLPRSIVGTDLLLNVTLVEDGRVEVCCLVDTINQASKESRDEVQSLAKTFAYSVSMDLPPHKAPYKAPYKGIFFLPCQLFIK